jgi:hypothetical protein
MLDFLQIGLSVMILAAVLALHVDLKLPRTSVREKRPGRVKHRPHDALRLTNL